MKEIVEGLKRDVEFYVNNINIKGAWKIIESSLWLIKILEGRRDEETLNQGTMLFCPA